MEPARIDLHCHLLPGIDDGPASTEEAVRLARGLVALGFSHVCCTPHQRQGYWDPAGPAVEAARTALQRELAAQGLALSLLPGGENHLDDRVLERLRRGELPALGERGRAVLLELPDLDVGYPLEPLLFEVQLAGLTPVVAHPERHSWLGRPRLIELRERGALLQLSLTSLGGDLGGVLARKSQELVQAGLIDLVATDAHGERHLPRLTEALNRLTRLVGEGGVRRMTESEPARVLGLKR